MSYRDEQHHEDAPEPEYTFTAGGDGSFMITVYHDSSKAEPYSTLITAHSPHKESADLHDYLTLEGAVSDAVAYILEEILPERYRNTR